MLSYQLINARLWKILERIRVETGWSHQDLAGRLSLTLRQYHKNRAKAREVSASSLLNLSRELSLDMESLAYGKIDFLAFARQFHGDREYLPDRYSIGALSRRRSSVHLLKYADDSFGKEVTDEILRKLQVSRLVFDRPDDLISIHFPTDFCNSIHTMGVSPRFFVKMGVFSQEINRTTLIGEKLRGCSSLDAAYDLQVNQLMKLYERNYKYHLKTVSKYVVAVEGAESEEVRDLLKVKHVGSPLTCLLKVGLANSIPRFFDLPEASTQETHCVHLGDSYCRFLINFEYPAAMLRKRRALEH